MKPIKTIAILAGLNLAMYAPALTFTGCDTIESLWEQTPDAVKSTVVSLGKAAAKLAINIGFTAFLDGVNETAPYREQLLSLLAAVDDAFETSADATQAATTVTADISSADLPDATKAALIEELMSALETQSEAEASTVAAAASPAENYGGTLYEALATCKEKLSTD